MTLSRKLLRPISTVDDIPTADVDINAEHGIGTAGARKLTTSYKQGFEFNNPLSVDGKTFWFACWIKPSSSSVDMQILGNTNGDGIYINASTGVIKIVDVGVDTEISTSSLVADTWQFLVVLLDYSNDLCKVYFDGVLDKSTTALVTNNRSRAARQKLIDDYGWSISDGGQA